VVFGPQQNRLRCSEGPAKTRAATRTAGLEKANEELRLELQSEKEARLAMSARSRDITDEQMAKFVDTVKGKVRQINLFTAPDREASIFGITILDALQKAMFP
jgi:hypothetical protein